MHFLRAVGAQRLRVGVGDLRKTASFSFNYGIEWSTPAASNYSGTPLPATMALYTINSGVITTVSYSSGEACWSEVHTQFMQATAKLQDNNFG